MTTNKPTLQLPLNPTNDYGKASTVHNIVRMVQPPTFYVGTNKDVEEMNVLNFTKLENGDYQIETDKAILIASSLTRINLKSNHQI